MPRDSSSTPDVTVIGGGMAGMAAAIHLASAGLRVTCLEPAPRTRQSVGESLDWAAPDLLGALGFDRDYLLNAGIATWKRHVTLRMGDAAPVQYAVLPRLEFPPWNVELNTLHVDRLALDRQIRERAESLGVCFIQDRAVSVERDGARVAAVRSANGARYISNWYIDASGGAASLFAREFRLRAHEYGPHKVAIWTYFAMTTPSEGTTIYTDAAPRKYLEWIWDIPVSDDRISVGHVTTGESMKRRRAEGLAVEDIFRAQLSRFPRFQPLLAGPLEKLYVTSFRCRTYKRVTGPNWVIAGEAASMVDPITSNGVSAALRQAAEGRDLILHVRKRSALPFRGRVLYSMRVRQMGRFFNSGIEKLVYDWPVRDRLGLPKAAYLYTAAAWSMNAVYSRLSRRGLWATLAFGASLFLLRCCAWLMQAICRVTGPGTRNP